MVMVLIVDGGMWSDPTIVGPFTDESAAGGFINRAPCGDQANDVEYVIVNSISPLAYR